MLVNHRQQPRSVSHQAQPVARSEVQVLRPQHAGAKRVSAKLSGESDHRASASRAHQESVALRTNEVHALRLNEPENGSQTIQELFDLRRRQSRWDLRISRQQRAQSELGLGPPLPIPRLRPVTTCRELALQQPRIESQIKK